MQCACNERNTNGHDSLCWRPWKTIFTCEQSTRHCSYKNATILVSSHIPITKSQRITLKGTQCQAGWSGKPSLAVRRINFAIRAIHGRSVSLRPLSMATLTTLVSVWACSRFKTIIAFLKHPNYRSSWMTKCFPLETGLGGARFSCFHCWPQELAVAGSTS